MQCEATTPSDGRPNVRATRRWRLLACAVVLGVLVLGGAGCTRNAEEKLHGDSLKIDERYGQAIEFTALGTRVPLGRNAYVREDAPVADTAEHLGAVLGELGVSGKRFSINNPATNGMQVHLRFRDGKQCSFIWAKHDADSRLTRSRVEHEKYHALCRLAPNAASTLSARISQLGFRVRLVDHSEEFAATLIEVITLCQLGISLEDIHGSELIVKAVGGLTRQPPQAGHKAA